MRISDWSSDVCSSDLDTVILESTSPVGTTEAMRDLFAQIRPDLKVPEPGVAGDIAIAYCPERVLPGRILVELIDNDRCIGGRTGERRVGKEGLSKVSTRWSQSH